jgi:hypothetical protein
MRLTMIQLFKKTVSGHIFKGKYRLVKPVSANAKSILITQYELQEENMLYLRHPYLTKVFILFLNYQSSRHILNSSVCFR